jgi:hypothetical protein
VQGLLVDVEDEVALQLIGSVQIPVEFFVNQFDVIFELSHQLVKLGAVLVGPLEIFRAHYCLFRVSTCRAALLIRFEVALSLQILLLHELVL